MGQPGIRCGEAEEEGEGESILQTIAEICVAFAGFMGVVAAFGRSGAAPWTAGDRLRFRVMLGTSLAVFDVRLYRTGRAQLGGNDSPSPLITTLVAFLSVGALLILFLNAAGVYFHWEFGFHLLGLAALLVISSLMSVRLPSFVSRADHSVASSQERA